MGNVETKQVPEEEKQKFGSYKSSSNPRPGYYKTPSEVYYRGILIESAIPSTFQKLGNSWAKDSKNVYFKGHPVNNADPKTFKVNGKEAQDKSGKWHAGKKIR